MKKSKPLIIFGLGPPGVYVYKKVYNYYDHVYALGRKGEPGFYVLKRNLYQWMPAFNPVQWVEKIETEHQCKPYILICSGFMLSLLLEKHPEILEKYPHSSPDIGLLKLLNNKDSTYQLLNKSGVASLPCFKSQDIDNIPFDHFPIIAKWNTTEVTKTDKLGKAVVVNYEQRHKLNISPNRVLQPFVAKAKQFSFAGFFEGGKAKIFVIVEQKRMYPKGASNYVNTMQLNHPLYEKIKSLGYKIINDLEYSGFGEFEFIYDEERRKLYLLEVNPRTWGWISIFDLFCEDFADCVLGNQGLDFTRYAKEYTYVNMPRLLGGNIVLSFPNQFWSTTRLLLKALFQIRKTKFEWLP